MNGLSGSRSTIKRSSSFHHSSSRRRRRRLLPGVATIQVIHETPLRGHLHFQRVKREPSQPTTSSAPTTVEQHVHARQCPP
jgi:hypothetical protein